VASDLRGWDIFKDPLWLLHNLYEKYKVVRVPTSGGWLTNNINGAAVLRPFMLYVNTSATANSRGLVYAEGIGLNSGDIVAGYCDWTKRLEIEFSVARIGSDSEVEARVQLKEANTEGILAQRGVGVSINNFDMVGEAYGTARDTLPLGTLASNRLARIKIVVRSVVVEFWVDGVLQGTLTGNAVPSVQATASTYMVISIINGPTGGVNAYLIASNIQITQEW